jgi:parallel beta-helix repeat protein
VSFLFVAGCSWWDDHDSSPATPPPSAPASAPLLAAGDNQLTVTWPPVSGATSYQVWYGPTDNSAAAIPFTGDVDATDNACTLTGLTNGTAVYVWLKAVNAGGASGFSPAGSATPAAPALSFTVNAATGDDATGNGTTIPYKTITKALSVAVAGDTVTVAPGTYDAALGETFPIVIPPLVRLVGDEANKGNGTTPTRIVGAGGKSSLLPFIGAAVSPGENTTVAGFVITATSPTITYPMGIVVEDNTVTIRNNRIVDSGKSGIYFVSGGNNCLVAGNVIRNNGVTPFNNGIGISFINGTGPGVRVENNVITANIVGVDYDAPAASGDLGGGATGSVGGNVIAGNFEIDLWTNVDAGVTISARNNLWNALPPTTTSSSSATGFDIYNQYGATIDTTGAALAP